MVTPFIIRIRGFEPRTYSGKKTINKKKVRDELLNELRASGILYKYSDGSKEQVSLRIKFFLFEDLKQSKRYEKDIDNLLKIVLDSISIYINQADNIRGVGLIRNDLDVWKVQAEKELVYDARDEGFELEIKKYRRAPK